MMTAVLVVTASHTVMFVRLQTLRHQLMFSYEQWPGEMGH
jgi:hypothetical protein